MDKNIVTNLVDVCLPLVLDSFNGNLAILYYSHIPTIGVSLFCGFFILIKSKKMLLSKIFFALALLLALWSVLDLYTWLSWNTGVQMFAWSITTLIEPLLFLLSLYFVYVFIQGKDAPLIYKIVGLLVMLPLVVILPTKLNLYAFNITDCYSLEYKFGLYYKYFIEIVSSIVIIVFSLVKIKNLERSARRRIWFLLSGVLLFLLSFFSVVFIGSYLADNGWAMSGYKFEGGGLFGAMFFIGILGYMTVRFKIFNVKIIKTQALVAVLVTLIASMYFFVASFINTVLVTVTFLLVAIFGRYLIKSVREEIRQKEELEILTRELSRANARLRKLDEAKTEFLSIASHQLRTPLTAIKGYLSLVDEGLYGKVGREMKEVLGKIHISNERLISLVEDLLNISRIEAGRMQYKFGYHQICEEIVGELRDSFELRAKEKGLELRFNRPKIPVPKIRMDKNKIREVLSNIVDNAIKYTDKGHVEMKVRKIGDVIKISVTDTGIGIPKAEIPHLFKKFSRGKDTKRLNADGTGLGIYLAKKIIKDHNGKIYIESDGKGKGSTFVIELPIVEVENEGEEKDK